MRSKTMYALSSRALSKSHVIARKSDWFIALFSPVVIGRSKYFGMCFRQSFENRSDIMERLWQLIRAVD